MEKFIKFIEAYDLIGKARKIYVALSGGADSMALLDLFITYQNTLSLEVEAIHIHHGLRKASDMEAEHVMAHCERLGIPCRTFYVDVMALAACGKSVEEAARDLRYEIFDKIIKEEGGQVALAHHLDDQAETVLMNLFRGSALKGLGGMQPMRDQYIRPLLDVTKEEIMTYCRLKSIPFEVDESNNDTKYTRNKLRLQIMPMLMKEIQPKLVEHICATASLVRDDDRYLEGLAEAAYDKAVIHQSKERIKWQRTVLCELDLVLLRRVMRQGLAYLEGGLRNVSMQHTEEMIALVRSGKTGKAIDLPMNRRLRCDYDVVTLDKDNHEEILKKQSIEVDWRAMRLHETYLYGDFCMRLFPFEKQKEFSKKSCTKWFDYDKIRGNLRIRTRENGDFIRFSPALHKKKIKDYFIDQKVNRSIRNQVPLLVSGNEVIWIVGYRINEAYKVTDATKTIIEVVYSKEERL
ncbi:tRNA lysidine(34) synthetase TilS [Petrocella sp. FN5]|uniref:tRNA lysidine(34) synthetase TilS n=1 Tax=Petrocella sp. FN5 TaxID=3032002 RepID=UPI0023DB8972|nr:tRNA lysidine(34) synthetase TilS [Petrocella sp. FN5]MDF1616480.1 tRNA lysidine(34) synthetase TilS [Petrocella sp. FN5]